MFAAAPASDRSRFRLVLPIKLRGSKARIGGRLPVKRSTSTVVSWPVQPCARRDVPASRVSTFGLPCTQSDRPPRDPPDRTRRRSASCTTPGRIPSVTRTRGEAGAARVEEADDVAVGDAARRGVRRMHARDLAAAMLGRRRCGRRNRAGCAAASPAGWRRAAAARLGARHIGRREPGGMAGAIGVAEAGDGLGEDLDPCRSGSCSGCAIRILAELRAACPPSSGACGKLELAALPRTPRSPAPAAPASARPARVGS